MNPRLSFIRQIFDASMEKLTPRDATYKQWVFRFTFLELEKDLGECGDITTEVLFDEHRECRARLVSRENGIVAGMQEVAYFLVESDAAFRPRIGSIAVQFLKKDGEQVVPGDALLELSGLARDVLAVERVLVNLVARMSGVATMTRKFVEAMGGDIVDGSLENFPLLAATRKTLWGLLDKRAVVLGGGVTHRLSLSDAILVKDNHLALFEGDITALLEKVFTFDGGQRFVEVEVESPQQALHVASSAQRIHAKSATLPFFLLLDNMKPGEICETIELLQKGKLHDDVLLEASGGVTLENIAEYAKTGVDMISSGSLTTGAKSLNLSLEVM
jgi:nicotinate-nucleotide pyrophosphorylase (carboxylating)